VEIDIYDGPDGDPIVTHVSSAWSGGSVTFLEVCALIAKEGFRETRGASPLILNLENNMSKQSKRAAEILMGAFGSRIVRVDDHEFGWEGIAARTTCPSPAELAGRVLCRSKPRDASEEYQNLIYLRNSPWRFGNVEEFSKKKYYQTSSLSESKVKGALKKLPAEITPVELNRMFLNRVYPRASAYASQNYNPLPYWLLGFQLVALNFQTDGFEMDMNRCMFERNSGMGFVLKAPLMRKTIRMTHARMNGGVRMSSRNFVGMSSSRALIQRSVMSNGGEPSPSHPTSRSIFSASSSSRFANRPLSDPSAKTNNVDQMVIAEPTNSTAKGLRRDSKSKSFMGVVEEALKNQNEDEEDINDEDDELPAPPPLDFEGDPLSNPVPEALLPPLQALPGSSSPSKSVPPLPLSTTAGPPSITSSPSGGLKHRTTSPPTLQPRNSSPAEVAANGLASSKRIAALSRTLSSQSSDVMTDSPEVQVKSLEDLDRELSKPNQPVKAMTDLALEDEEKKRRARARRRSTGSILKPPDVTERAPEPTRKRSLEDPGSSRDLMRVSPSTPFHHKALDFFGEEDLMRTRSL